MGGFSRLPANRTSRLRAMHANLHVASVLIALLTVVAAEALFAHGEQALVETYPSDAVKTMATHPHAVVAEREAIARQVLHEPLAASHAKAERLRSIGHEQPKARSGLVVYDWNPDRRFGREDFLQAILLRNVLSHYLDDVQLVSLSNYEEGSTELYDATFFVGGWNDDPLPDVFVRDIVSTDRTIVWLHGNPDRLARQSGTTTSALFGFSASELALFDGPTSPEQPYPGFFDTVMYKGLPFVKYHVYDPADGLVHASPELVRVRVEDSARTVVHVEAGSLVSGETVPWLLQSGNFWLVTDQTMTFLHARDRYLVLCDVLHDVLGSDHPNEHRAMVRLEDVHVMILPDAIEHITDFFHARDVPFSVAAIPEFRDPLGRTGRRERAIDFDDWTARPLIDSLRDASKRGASILMHGVTHQFGDRANPYNGVSGSDYEFFDVVRNAPVEEDNVAFFSARLERGREILEAANLPPFAFEVPHYLASPKASRAIARTFKATYQRVTYFTSDEPDLGCDDGTCDLMSGQFFPFVIPEDYYGQRVIPENLGNLQYNRPFQPKEFLVENARYARVVRDGFASFFFHPFLLGDIDGVDAFADLEFIIDGITALGYGWTDAATLAEPRAGTRE